MKMTFKCAASLSLLLCFPCLASAADHAKRCDVDILKGRYILAANGFTRAPGSLPGSPWVPKAIIEVLQFNGDGTLTTPGVNLANGFGDLGTILQIPAGSDGTYSINDDCGGTLHFGDANGVSYKFYVDAASADKIWLIQTNPANNVFQGTATRVSVGTCENGGSELRELTSPGCS
jgi:hypothetical protein